MALVSCPECGNSVSERAPACPKCGAPIAAQTIEATGKGWKAAQLIFGLGAVASIIWCVASCTSLQRGEQLNPAPMIPLFVSLLGYAGARIGAWWHHG